MMITLILFPVGYYHKLSFCKHIDITCTSWIAECTKRHNQINRRIILPNENMPFLKVDICVGSYLIFLLLALI